MRIQTKIMRIHADADLQHWYLGIFTFHLLFRVFLDLIYAELIFMSINTGAFHVWYPSYSPLLIM
jgi:hypothetical protein